MLALTEDAATAIKGLVESASLPDAGGLRITLERTAEDGAALTISLAAEAAEKDQTVTESGAHVFLDPPAAEILGDRVLDATVHGDEIGFTLGPAVHTASQNGRPTRLPKR